MLAVKLCNNLVDYLYIWGDLQFKLTCISTWCLIMFHYGLYPFFKYVVISPNVCFVSKERKLLLGRTTWPVQEQLRNIISATLKWVTAFQFHFSSLYFTSLLKQTLLTGWRWRTVVVAGSLQAWLYVAVWKWSRAGLGTIAHSQKTIPAQINA